MTDAQWDTKANPQYYVFIQGWMLLALGVSIFVPKSSKLLWFLRTHFARNKDERYHYNPILQYLLKLMVWIARYSLTTIFKLYCLQD